MNLPSTLPITLIGPALRIIRRDQKIKQYIAAQDIGITQAYLCQIEKGNRMPILVVLSKMLDYYGYDFKIEERL